jgi:hypothetical protein
MKYENLTQEQKEWIKEFQIYMTKKRNEWSDYPRNPTPPEVIIDRRTGEVFANMGFGIDEWIEGENPIGKIPRKAIPFRIMQWQRNR